MDAKSIQAAALGGVVGGAAVYCCIRLLPGLSAGRDRWDTASTSSLDRKRGDDEEATDTDDRPLLRTLTVHDRSPVWWLPVIVRECLSGEREPEYVAPQLSAVADISHFGGATRAKNFLLESGVAYLNHGGYGACLRCAMDAQSYYRQRVEAAPIRFMEEEALPGLAAALKDVADFVHAKPTDMALVPNATVGFHTVFRSVPLAEEDTVLILSTVYGSLRSAAWHYASEAGAKVVEFEVKLPLDRKAFMAEFKQAVASLPSLRLAVLDHISSCPPVLFDVGEMARACRSAGALVFVDGAHAVGQIDLHVPKVGADFYVSNLHKWCMTPKGSAFLWVAPARQEMVRPLAFSHGYGLGFTSEFIWQGTVDYTPYLATRASLRWMWMAGPATIRRHNHELVTRAARMLASAWGTEVLTGAEDDVELSLASVRVPDAAVADIAAGSSVHDLTRAMRRQGIEVVVFTRGPHTYVRISAQVYNEMAEYERLRDAILLRAARE